MRLTNDATPVDRSRSHAGQFVLLHAFGQQR